MDVQYTNSFAIEQQETLTKPKTLVVERGLLAASLSPAARSTRPEREREKGKEERGREGERREYTSRQERARGGVGVGRRRTRKNPIVRKLHFSDRILGISTKPSSLTVISNVARPILKFLRLAIVWSDFHFQHPSSHDGSFHLGATVRSRRRRRRRIAWTVGRSVGRRDGRSSILARGSKNILKKSRITKATFKM